MTPPAQPEGPNERPRQMSRRAWGMLLREFTPTVRAMAQARGLDRSVADDAVQEAWLRYFQQVRAGRLVRDPVHWLLRVARNILLDVLRGRPGPVGPLGVPQETAAAPLHGRRDPRARDPAERAAMRELWASAPNLFTYLPRPYEQIAICQYILGWRRREIVAHLRLWNPQVSTTSARRYLRKTHAMLRDLGLGRGGRKSWKEKISKKSVWYVTPPPTFASVGVEAAWRLPVVGGRRAAAEAVNGYA